MILNRIKGFTLIETIITLTVTCLLVLMPTLYVKNIKEQMILDNSTRQIKSTINKYMHLATVEKKNYIFLYFDNNSSIEIKGSDRTSKIYLDRHVKVYNLDNLYINNHGRVSPRTITVRNGNKEKKIKLQMAWGRMIEE